MLDLNSTYPEAEELTLAFNRTMAQLRDNLTDLELLFSRIMKGETFVSEEEVVSILRCKNKGDIPAALRRYRPGGKTGYLYKVDEIYRFINSKAIGKEIK